MASRRSRSLSTPARWFAWAGALGAVTMVALSYHQLPNELPSTRWSSAPRSWLMALRVPTINLLSVSVIDMLARALSRSSRPEDGERVGAALFVTIGLKALLEGIELVMLPWSGSLLPILLLVVVVGGLTVAIARGRRVFARSERGSITFVRAEQPVAALAVAGILALQLVPAFQ